MRKNTCLFFTTLVLLCSTFFNLKAQTPVATGLSSTSSLAIKGTDLYVADQTAGKIYKIDLSVSPAKQEEFVKGLSYPTGLAILGNDLYVSQFTGKKVTKINLSSKAQSDAITGLSGPYGLTFKGNELYVAEDTGQSVKKKDVTTTGTTPILVSSGVNTAHGLAFNGNDLYVGSFIISAINKIDIGANPITRTNYASQKDLTPQQLAVHGDYLYIAVDFGKIARINLTKTSVAIDDVITGLNTPTGVLIYNDSLYVADKGQVLKYPLPCDDAETPKRSGNTLSITAIDGATYQWIDCRNNNLPIAGATSNSYTATANGNYAVEVTTSKCKVTSDCAAVYGIGRVTVASGFTDATNFALKGSDLYVTDQVGKVYKIDLSVSPEKKTEIASGLNTPTGIEILGNDLYVSEFLGNKVTKINLSSKAKTDAITGLNAPWGLAFKGNELYVAENIGQNILKKDVTTAGTKSSPVVLGIASPIGLAFNGNDLYAGSFNSNLISKIDVGVNPITRANYASKTVLSPHQLAIDGDYLYIVYGFDGISRVNIKKSPGVIEDVILGLRYETPLGVAIYGDFIYVAAKSRVYKYPKPCPAPYKPVVTKSGGTLSTTAVAGATYQWLDCDNNNAPITGATATSYTATKTGNYALRITSSGGCKNVSECVAITEVPVASGFTRLFGAVVNGNDLYVSDNNGRAIFKLDLSTNPVTKTTLKGGLGTPFGVAVLGNDIYYVNNNAGTVSKINLTTKQETAVITGGLSSGSTFDLAFKGNELYVLTSKKVVKANVTGTLPITSPTDVMTGLSSFSNFGIAFRGNELYAISEKKIFKKDVTTGGTTPTEVFSGLNNPVSLVFDGDYLYISEEGTATPSTGKVSRIDVTASSIAKKDVKTGLTYPSGLAIYGDELYINVPKEINKVRLPCPESYNPVVTNTGGLLSIPAVSRATYQWLDCNNNNAPITGATNNSYAPLTAGNYAVEVKIGSNCKFTSACLKIVDIPVAREFTNLFGSVVKGNNLYVTNTKGSESEIFEIDLSTRPATKKLLKGGLNRIFGVAILGDELYYVNNNGGTVSKINLITKQETDVITTGLAVGVTFDLAFKGNELYVLTSGKVVKADVTGTLPITSLTDVMTGLSSFSNFGLAFKGNELYVTVASDGGKIFKKDVTTSGTSPTEVFSGLSNPLGLVFDGDYLYISEELGSKVSRINITANPITKTEVKPGLKLPNGLAIYEGELYINTPKEIYKVKLPCPDSPIVKKAGNTLSTAAVAGATYQWINCRNNSPILNATTTSYTPTANGNYAVEIKTERGCKIVSVCTEITEIGRQVVATGFTEASALAIKGSDLYVSDATTNKIFKIDLSVNSPRPINFVTTGLNGPRGLAIKDNDLYVAQWSDNKVTKIDLTSEAPTDVITGLKSPWGLGIQGNELYVTEDLGNRVLKKDITTAGTAATGVLSGVNASRGVAIKGTDLYAGSSSSNMIYKADLTASSISKTNYLGIEREPHQLLIDGDYLYIAVAFSGKISRINLTKTLAAAEDIITGLTSSFSTPTGIAIYNNFIYIAAKTRILRYPLPCVNADKPIVTKSGNTLSTTMVSGLRYQWVDCSDNSPITNATTNIYTPTVSGTYAVQITSSGGCKEISECTMICIANQPVVTNNSGVLSITEVTGATYQWLDCNNSNAPISGATINTYSPMATGNYAVEVTINGCKDVSVCTMVCIANKPVVTNNSGVLSTTAVNGATYQWVDCNNNNAPISGATANSYTPRTNGSYAVEVIQSATCKSTSDCIIVANLGFTESTFANDVKLYPNPTTRDVTIELGENYNKLTVEITNLLGQVITSKTIEKVTNQKIVLPINASKGVYFISIKAKEGFARFRIIKE